ncbi:Uncharacterised protein [Mycobacteroides abscessus subsp. abscessus]|nr:Uncharacterised protein [Mycobacteroides abscessus subsp. abscessus]
MPLSASPISSCSGRSVNISSIDAPRMLSIIENIPVKKYCAFKAPFFLRTATDSAIFALIRQILIVSFWTAFFSKVDSLTASTYIHFWISFSPSRTVACLILFILCFGLKAGELISLSSL